MGLEAANSRSKLKYSEDQMKHSMGLFILSVGKASVNWTADKRQAIGAVLLADERGGCKLCYEHKGSSTS